MKLTAALALAFILLLPGCNTTPASSSPSPQNAVFAAKNAYEAALIVAVRYAETPRCPVGAPICSDQKVVEIIRTSNNSARTALDAAEKTVRDPAFNTDTKTAAATAATNAVTAMQSILNLYAAPAAKKGP